MQSDRNLQTKWIAEWTLSENRTSSLQIKIGFWKRSQDQNHCKAEFNRESKQQKSHKPHMASSLHSASQAATILFPIRKSPPNKNWILYTVLDS